MKISFKYAILAPIFGVMMVTGMYFGAPIILSALGAVTATAAPTDAEVCAHFDAIKVALPDCQVWLDNSKELMGKYYDSRQRCFMGATDVEGAMACDNPVEYMTDRWE